MPQPDTTTPAPFLLAGGSVGVLLIHGFTGAPSEMRRLADYLHQHDFTVSGPLLPGHGTSVADLNRTRWQQWTAHVEAALADLRSRCETVFVGGLSLGGVLSLYLAAQHPDLAGALLYAPAMRISGWRARLVPLLKYVVRVIPKGEEEPLADPESRALHWCYDEYPVVAAHEAHRLIAHVRRQLPRVTCPLLIAYSLADPVVPTAAVEDIVRGVSTDDISLLTLERSGHVVTLDAEWQQVAEKTVAFIRAHLPETEAAG